MLEEASAATAPALPGRDLPIPSPHELGEGAGSAVKQIPNVRIPSPHEVGRGLGRGVPSIESSAYPAAFAPEEHGNLALVERALAQANCRREEIAVVAVGLGPGSYTGIRSAIALAQGWQLGRGVKTLGISSVECLALAQVMRKAGLRRSNKHCD